MKRHLHIPAGQDVHVYTGEILQITFDLDRLFCCSIDLSKYFKSSFKVGKHQQHEKFDLECIAKATDKLPIPFKSGKIDGTCDECKDNPHSIIVNS